MSHELKKDAGVGMSIETINDMKQRTESIVLEMNPGMTGRESYLNEPKLSRPTSLGKEDMTPPET